jgi:hypothetical protein
MIEDLISKELRGCKMVNVPGIGRVVVQRLGPQHYLAWRDGKPVAEVKKFASWFWNGALQSRGVPTMREALRLGVGVTRKGGRLTKDGRVPADWSPKAMEAIGRQHAG